MFLKWDWVCQVLGGMRWDPGNRHKVSGNCRTHQVLSGPREGNRAGCRSLAVFKAPYGSDLLHFLCLRINQGLRGHSPTCSPCTGRAPRKMPRGSPTSQNPVGYLPRSEPGKSRGPDGLHPAHCSPTFSRALGPQCCGISAQAGWRHLAISRNGKQTNWKCFALENSLFDVVWYLNCPWNFFFQLHLKKKKEVDARPKPCFSLSPSP